MPYCITIRSLSGQRLKLVVFSNSHYRMIWPKHHRVLTKKSLFSVGKTHGRDWRRAWPCWWPPARRPPHHWSHHPGRFLRLRCTASPVLLHCGARRWLLAIDRRPRFWLHNLVEDIRITVVSVPTLTGPWICGSIVVDVPLLSLGSLNSNSSLLAI